ncbi:cytidine deaminase [Intrasporangium oryzae NRRL B-24470]|uniref:tRNA-specific adenosine deaminase n=1 Tax=Intrasporangium oryzae NRRL B-24470 TaxID=1386089 RepID=W9G9X3_9MICO|nr:nucleoside deaminase [Intrasporangium oryzae]EWT00669.1 cytidine deaminase [Intrasporangium oryzae NRRL B-24470]
MKKDSETPAGGSVETYAAWLGEALAVASEAASSEDVPVGAVVVDPEGVVIARGRNVREERGDPTGHAEIVAIREAAAALGTWRLEECTLVVTLEPCVMCAGAAMAARVERIVFGAWDPKAGACGSVWDLTRDRLATHRVDVVGGVRAQESAALLVDFFESHRVR